MTHRITPIKHPDLQVPPQKDPQETACPDLAPPLALRTATALDPSIPAYRRRPLMPGGSFRLAAGH